MLLNFPISAIRKTLETLDNDTLVGFCQDHLPDIASDFADQMAKSQKINLIFERCLTEEKQKRLLTALKEDERTNIEFAKHLKSIEQKETDIREIDLQDPNLENVNEALENKNEVCLCLRFNGDGKLYQAEINGKEWKNAPREICFDIDVWEEWNRLPSLLESRENLSKSDSIKILQYYLENLPAYLADSNYDYDDVDTIKFVLPSKLLGVPFEQIVLQDGELFSIYLVKINMFRRKNTCRTEEVSPSYFYCNGKNDIENLKKILLKPPKLLFLQHNKTQILNLRKIFNLLRKKGQPFICHRSSSNCEQKLKEHYDELMNNSNNISEDLIGLKENFDCCIIHDLFFVDIEHSANPQQRLPFAQGIKKG